MTKTLSIQEKIKQAETLISQLKPIRKNEIADIFDYYKGTTIDNKLIIAFIELCADPSNKNHPVMQELSERSKNIKIPRSVFKSNKTTT